VGECGDAGWTRRRRRRRRRGWRRRGELFDAKWRRAGGRDDGS